MDHPHEDDHGDTRRVALKKRSGTELRVGEGVGHQHTYGNQSYRNRQDHLKWGCPVRKRSNLDFFRKNEVRNSTFEEYEVRKK